MCLQLLFFCGPSLMFYPLCAFYVHYSSLLVTHLQVLMDFSVIIEKSDLIFWLGDLPTVAVFAQKGALSAC